MVRLVAEVVISSTAHRINSPVVPVSTGTRGYGRRVISVGQRLSQLRGNNTERPANPGVNSVSAPGPIRLRARHFVALCHEDPSRPYSFNSHRPYLHPYSPFAPSYYSVIVAGWTSPSISSSRKAGTKEHYWASFEAIQGVLRQSARVISPLVSYKCAMVLAQFWHSPWFL